MKNITVPVKIMEHARDLPLPGYMTKGAAGMDLPAAVTETIIIPPGKVEVVPTGLAVAVPEGYEFQIRPRSGLAAGQGIGVLNSPGTIDSDYRGEIKVIVINMGAEPFLIDRGDRIAQIVLCPVFPTCWQEVPELPPTGRGQGGFGHTGTD